jgi:hypothetical protein
LRAKRPANNSVGSVVVAAGEDYGTVSHSNLSNPAFLRKLDDVAIGIFQIE